MNFVFFGVKKSGISVFLVSFENGAGVNKMTYMTYAVISPKTVSVFENIANLQQFFWKRTIKTGQSVYSASQNVELM